MRGTVVLQPIVSTLPYGCVKEREIIARNGSTDHAWHLSLQWRHEAWEPGFGLMVAFHVTAFLGHLSRRDPWRTCVIRAFLLGQTYPRETFLLSEGMSRARSHVAPQRPSRIVPIATGLGTGPRVMTHTGSFRVLGSRISPQHECVLGLLWPSQFHLYFETMKAELENIIIPFHSQTLLALMGSHFHKHPNGNCHSNFKTIKISAPENTQPKDNYFSP